MPVLRIFGGIFLVLFGFGMLLRAETDRTLMVASVITAFGLTTLFWLWWTTRKTQ